MPFYRDSGRLDRIFRRDGTIDWSRWRDIPILTRAEVRDQTRALTSEMVPDQHGQTWTVSTSGSTGEPVTVTHTAFSGFVSRTAVMLRDFERHNIDPSRRLVYINYFSPGEIDHDGGARREHWFEEFAALGLKGERFDLADSRGAADMIEAIAQWRPDYIRVQPKNLELLCANCNWIHRHENDLQAYNQPNRKE